MNSVIHRVWLVCCLCVVCLQAQAWQSGDTIAIVYEGNYLTATSETTVGKTTTPTEASLWVVTAESTMFGTNYYLTNIYYSGCYLRNNNGTLVLTSNANDRTAWQWDNRNGAFKSGNNYLIYNTRRNQFQCSSINGNNKTPLTLTPKYTLQYIVPWKDVDSDEEWPISYGWPWATSTKVFVAETKSAQYVSSGYATIQKTITEDDKVLRLTTKWEPGQLNPVGVDTVGTTTIITTEHEPAAADCGPYEFKTRLDTLTAECVLKNGKTVIVTPLPMKQPVGRCEWVEVSSLAMTPDNYTFENRDMTHDFKLMLHTERGRRWYLSDKPDEAIDTAVVKKDSAVVLTPAAIGIERKVLADNWKVTLIDDSIMRVSVDGISATAVNPAATLGCIYIDGDKYTTYTAALVQIVNPGEYKFYHQKGASGSNYDARYMQGVHTVNYTVYLEQGEKFTFVLPEGAFRGYWRWYDYDTDLAAANLNVPNNTRTATPHGIFGTQTSVGSCGAYFTMPDNNVHRIACDVSSYLDYSFLNDNKEITEPTLSYRVIYEIRPANEMVDTLSTYTGDTYLENYKLTAGTCNPIYLGPQYNYLSGGLHNNYYVKTNKGDVEQVNQYEWKEGSTTLNPTIVGSKYAKVESSTSDTKTYTLRCRYYKNNTTYSAWVNVACFTVTYKACDEVGPWQESNGGIVSNSELDSKYQLLAKLDFDYDKPGTTAYRAYNKPLAWDEATYGFCYIDAANPPEYRTFSGAFPYYGEYMFINTTRGSNAGWLAATDNRSGAENGYMLYCDGTTMAGQVASLDLKAELCAGSRMFCSAWINSANTESYGASPVFQFQLVGIDAEGNEHEQTTFSTGEIKPNLGWQQVFFSIESDADYEKYRLRISNHCGASNGNDFLIDDIRVYQSTQVLSSTQSTTACSDDESSNLITPITRVDFQSMGVNGIDLSSATCYYQWYNETTGKIFTDFDYINPNAAHTCGSVVLPADDAEIDALYSSQIYSTIHDFQTQHAADKSKRVGYIKENVDGFEHYVLYLIEDIACGADTTITFRAAFREQDLEHALCAMSSSFVVVPRVQLTLNNEPMISASELICANTSYRLSVNVYDSHDRVSTCLSDWLYGSPADSTDASNIAVYGCTFVQMVDALTDLRQPMEIDGNPNPNLSVTSIDGIDRQYISDDSYNILCTLVNRGLLTLAAEYVDIIITQTATDLDLNRVVIPINGTCVAGYDVCDNPIAASFKLCTTGGYNLTLGRRGEKDQIQNQIRGVRVSKDFSTFYLPVDTSYYVNIDTVLLVSSDDPDFVSEDVTRFVLQPDQREFTVWTPSILGITLTPNTSISNFTLKQGYSYTFGIRLTNAFKQDSIEVGTNKKCPVGTTYFTVKVVPDYAVWSPNGNSTSWNNDDNWAMADETGNVVRGGFVPMEHTDIIIPDLGENGAYPVLNTSAVVPDHQAAPVEASAQQYISYDFDYDVNKCHNVHFKTNAQLGNQHMLSYNKAWIEMLLPTWRWHMYAFPITGVVSGDMYVPLDNYADAVPFTSGGACDNRTVYYFAQSMFNRAVSNMYESGQQVDITSVTWSAPTNAMNVSYPVGTGAAMWVYNSSNYGETNVMVCLPKDETRYYYYYANGQVSDIYEDIERPADYGRFGFVPTFGATDTTMTITLTNTTAGKLFVVGNPAMSTLNLQELFALNDDIFTGTFYHIPDTEGSDMMDMEACTKYTIDMYNGYLQPCHSILAETKTEATSIDVKFRTSMFKLNRALANEGTQQQAAPMAVAAQRVHTKRIVQPSQLALLQVTALCNDYYSTLLLGETPEASADFVPGEDAELITFADQYMETASAHTVIYTKADNKPLSVNVLDRVNSVPLTYHCADGKQVTSFTVWFDGVSMFDYGLQLYDDYEQVTIPLCDGMMLELEGVPSDYPRYYIQRRNYVPGEDDNTPTDQSPIDADALITAYTQPNGTVLVAASTELDAVRAYSTTGQLILEQNNIAQRITQFTLPTGAYLLKISTTTGDTAVRKIVLR